MSDTTVSAGQTVSGFTVSAGGTLDVMSGGTAIAITIPLGGTLDIAGGGTALGVVASGADVIGAAFVTVAAGGFGSGIIADGEASVTVQGVASDTVVDGGPDHGAGFYVDAGGTALGVTLGDNTYGFVYAGGLIVSTTISSGGLALVSSGATALGTTVLSDGGVSVQYGAIASGTVFPSTVVITSGETSSGLVIGADVTLDVESGGTAFDTVVTAEGYLAVSRGGVTSDTVVSGGFEAVSAGGSAVSTTVSSGGVLHVAFGGTDIGTVNSGGVTVNVPCFAAGTLILTEQGELPVEHLAVGDLIPTEDGAVEPVIWIGSRHVDCRRHPRRRQVLPVRISAHAFGRNEPRRELLLSPDHAVFSEGTLIPVKHLINGETIRQIDTPAVTYVHVELRRHAVILAEGLPCETYLDTGDRGSFAGTDGPITLHPAFGSERCDLSLVMEAAGYAPLRVTGPEVEKVRARLAARAASADAPPPPRVVVNQSGRGDPPDRA